MKYYELKNATAKTLFPFFGEDSEHEAVRLICFSADTMSSVLLARLSSEVPQTVADKTAALTQRRISGEPLEYICGKAGFFGMELFVSPDVLIPQSDTEVVCEQALARLARGGRVADICCGSGNIALALMRERDVFADMFDSSPAALVVAKKNLRLFGFSEKARLLCRDVFSDGFFDGCDKYDLIVSNPPYIRTDVIETLSKDVQSEPRAALDGGYDGLRFYRRLLAICPVMLKAGGVMIFEIGFDQKTDISSLCEQFGLKCEFFRDYGGNDRGFIARKK